MTKLLYLQDPKLFRIEAVIVDYGQDQRGSYVVLDQTVFYPQGGGQPADQGEIDLHDEGTLYVHDVRLEDSEVRHYVNELPGKNIKNRPVSIAIDPVRRGINTRCHSAGHLLGAVAEACYPNLQAIKGHHFPGEAYVEFLGEPDSDDPEALQSLIDSVISENLTVQTRNLEPNEAADIIVKLPYTIPTDKELRICEIGNYDPIPCGGTHVSSLSEIGSVKITKIKAKKGKTKISYEV
jgi:alanyl-tRNA synthetase